MATALVKVRVTVLAVALITASLVKALVTIVPSTLSVKVLMLGT